MNNLFATRRSFIVGGKVQRSHKVKQISRRRRRASDSSGWTDADMDVSVISAFCFLLLILPQISQGQQGEYVNSGCAFCTPVVTFQKIIRLMGLKHSHSDKLWRLSAYLKNPNYTELQLVRQEVTCIVCVCLCVDVLDVLQHRWVRQQLKGQLAMRCYTKLSRSVLYFLVISYDLTLWCVPGELMTWLQDNRSIATSPQQMDWL